MEEEIPTGVITVGGKRIVLYQISQGFPVVLLHGLVAKGAWSLKHLARKLSEHFWVIGVHLPGYEDSEEFHFGNYQQLARMLRALAERIGIHGKFHLFGHSTGGTIALVATSLYPDRIGKLALFEAPFTQENVWRAWRIAAFFARTPGFIWALRQTLPRTPIPDFKGGRSVPIDAVIRIGKILTESDFTPGCQKIAEFGVPTLLVFGQKSSLLLSLPSMKEIIRFIPDAQQIEIEGADHTLKREFQERLAEELISFFLN